MKQPNDPNAEASQKVFDVLANGRPIHPAGTETLTFNERGTLMPTYSVKQSDPQSLTASLDDQDDFEMLTIVQKTEFVEGTWIWDFVKNADKTTAAAGSSNITSEDYE